MIFSEDDVVAILKKSLPKTDYKDLGKIAESIVGEAKNWQEVDLNEHVRDEMETQVLRDICQRKSNNDSPKKIRLFFKE